MIFSCKKDMIKSSQGSSNFNEMENIFKLVLLVLVHIFETYSVLLVGQ
jgi:hypothetical protein